MQRLEKIAVLMSTYNGEKYIKEQIESILAQEGVHLDLYIRDDGSADATMNIIKNYETCGHVKVIPSEHNLGPGRSFMTLLYHVAALNVYDYYAFADQDDIWLPQKLKVAIEKLRSAGDSPSLYGSNRIILENGENKGLVYKNDLEHTLQQRIASNKISGCTMVLNEALVKRIVSHNMPPAEIIDYRYHDLWVLLVALVTGNVIYDHDSYILYRIHEGNVAGIKKASIIGRVNQILKRRALRVNLRSKSAKLLLEYYPGMSNEHKNILTKYANYRASMRDKWGLMTDKELIMAAGENPIIFGLKVLMNFV